MLRDLFETQCEVFFVFNGTAANALAVSLCYTCHSTEYMRYQPTTSPRAYWKATVTKMQKTFGAPIPDDVVEPITDYLVKTYGAERASASEDVE